MAEFIITDPLNMKEEIKIWEVGDIGKSSKGAHASP